MEGIVLGDRENRTKLRCLAQLLQKVRSVQAQTSVNPDVNNEEAAALDKRHEPIKQLIIGGAERPAPLI